MSDKKSIPEMSADTRAIVQRLARCKPQDMVTYKELSALVGRNIQNGARYLLSSAIRALLRDRMVFESVRNEGVKRLADGEIVDTSGTILPRVRRMAKRGIRKLTAVENFNELPNAAKVKHNTAISHLGLLAHLSTEKSAAQIEVKVEEAKQSLSLSKALDAFK